MNGGALNSNAEPATTPVYSATNGGWNSGTGVFTPTSGDPSATVTVGDFASVFLDGATTPVFIARVTARTTTTVTVSTTVKVGTAPTTAGTGISINVGGAWLGPTGTVGFPFNFVTGALTNTALDNTRINFKNDQTYSITAAISTPSIDQGCFFQGYTSTFGDGGKATLTDSSAGASYVLLNMQYNFQSSVEDFIFDGNGTTGSADGVGATRGFICRRCIFKNMRGNGINGAFGSVPLQLIECEAYGNNLSNTSGKGGIQSNIPLVCVRCYSHNNTGSNVRGFSSGAGCYIDCIAANNGAQGFIIASNGNGLVMSGCDSYNNGGAGLESNNSNLTYVENCNFVKNGGYGVNFFSTLGRAAYFINCAFGSGTQANTSGTFNTTGSSRVEVDTVTLAANVTPWVDPANGDFTINLAAVEGAGHGEFLQTVGSAGTSVGGTIGYPDIGAAQHQDTGGGGGTGISRARGASGF